MPQVPGPSIVDLNQLPMRERFEALARMVRQDPTGSGVAARQLLASPRRRARALGADVIGQVAAVSPPARGWAVRSLLRALQRESSPDVIASIVVSLGHAGGRSSRYAIVALANHASASVRTAVAFALSTEATHHDVVPVLLTLSKDADRDVRHWATFGLGSANPRPEVLAALRDRLGDEDGETRIEALISLIRQRDVVATDLVGHRLRDRSVRKWVESIAANMNDSPTPP